MQCYVFIEGMERPPSLRKLTSWTEPGRLAQPALPLQRIAAFASLARNLRHEAHVRSVKILGHQGLRVPRKWPKVSGQKFLFC